MQFSKNKRNIQWDKYMVYIIFVAVFILFAIILGNKGFIQPRNLINILRQTAMISVMAVAGVFVMAAGQIDLTVGSITAMTAMIVSLVIQSTNNIFLALIAGIGFGVAVGCINGLLVTKLKLPAFLATLGTMELVRGAAMYHASTAECMALKQRPGAWKEMPAPAQLLRSVSRKEIRTVARHPCRYFHHECPEGKEGRCNTLCLLSQCLACAGE